MRLVIVLLSLLGSCLPAFAAFEREDVAGTYPSVRQIVGDYLNAWSYTPPENYPDEDLDELEESRAKASREIKLMPEFADHLYSNLQRKVFFQIYYYKSAQFFQYADAYQKLLKRYEREKAEGASPKVIYGMQAKLANQFKLATHFHSGLAANLVQWCEDVGAMNDNKLVVMNRFFEFERKAKATLPDWVYRKIVEPTFYALVNHEDPEFADKQVYDVSKLLASAYKVMSSLQEKPLVMTELYNQLERLTAALNQYWQEGDTDKMEYLETLSCKGILTIGS